MSEKPGRSTLSVSDLIIINTCHGSDKKET
jgi:hypothetical protein